MAREKSPAFQWYPKDFLSDGPCVAMSCAEVGAYTRLLSHCWLEQTLPLDDGALARMAGASPSEWARLKPAVMARFQESAEGYRHGRLDTLRQEQADWREQSSRGGRKSSASRRLKFGSADPRAEREPNVNRPLHVDREPNVNTPSPSPSASASACTPTEPTVPTVSVPRAPAKPLAYRPRIDVAWPGRPPVPGSLHAEFRSKLGGNPDDAERRLNAWYPVAAAPYDGRDIGDDDFRFWRARFREWVGTTERAGPPSRTAGNRAAADEALRLMGQRGTA